MNEKLFLTTGISLPKVLEAFGDSIAVIDSDLKFVAANKNMADMYGIDLEEVVGKNAYDIYPNWESSIFYDNAMMTIKEGVNTAKLGYSQNTKRWLLVRTAQVGDGLSAMMNTSVDLSSLNIGYGEARYDTLTALKNRNTFEQDLVTIYKEQQSEFGIVFVDIRAFRLFNELYGVKLGDKVLLEVGSRLRSAGGIFNQVYRVGADKFAVIIPKKREECIFEIHRLHSLLAGSFLLGEMSVHVDTSIGFMYVDMFKHKPSYIIEEADFALSQSKIQLSTQVYHEHILTLAIG